MHVGCHVVSPDVVAAIHRDLALIWAAQAAYHGGSDAANTAIASLRAIAYHQECGGHVGGIH